MKPIIQFHGPLIWGGAAVQRCSIEELPAIRNFMLPYQSTWILVANTETRIALYTPASKNETVIATREPKNFNQIISCLRIANFFNEQPHS